MGKRPRFIQRTSTTWAAPDGHTWLIEMDWAEVNGRAECVGMALRSYVPADPYGRPETAEGTLMPVGRDNEVRPVRADIVRRMTMAEVERMRAGAADVLRDEREDAHLGAAYERWRASSLAAFDAPSRRVRKLTGKDGTPLAPADALAEVAAVYREAWDAGPNPTRTVAETFGLTRSAAAKRVSRARDAGLLPKNPGQGRPSAAEEES